MFVVAKSVKGHEYMYSAKTAHKVSKASANYICKVLNEYNFNLKEGEVWHVHEVGTLDNAYDFAQIQKFTNRKGIVKRVGRYEMW